MFNILLRINDKIEQVNSKRTVCSKYDVIRLCFKSLISNINSYGREKVNLHIFYDNLSEDGMNFLKQYVDDSIMHHVIPGGNTQTFNAEYQLGKTLDGPVLLLEDDYFYPNSLQKISDFYYEHKNIEEHFCINIMEDFVSWLGDTEDFLFEVDNITWRKMHHSTFTFLTDSYVLNTCKAEYELLIKYYWQMVNGERITEDQTIDKVYDKFSCYAPTPSLTEHMQCYETLSRNSPFKAVYRGENIHTIISNIEEPR